MDAHPRALVHQLLACRLHLDAASIGDADRFDHLGLAPLDLVLVVLKLEGLDQGNGEFPLYALRRATTVGDLVDLVELWLERETVPVPAARRPDATTDHRRS